MVEAKKIVKRRIVEEEEVGKVEEGVAECEYCGGELKEEFGVFKCVNCGKEAATAKSGALLKKELAEKRVSPAELKEFGARVKALTLPELADFCLRLFTTAYGHCRILEQMRKNPDGENAASSIDSIKGGLFLGKPVVFVKDAGTVFVEVRHEKCHRAFYCSPKPISKQEAEDAMQTTKKSHDDLGFLVAFAGVEKGVEELIEDYKEVKILTVQDVFLLAREHEIKPKTVNPAIRLEVPEQGIMDGLVRKIWKLQE